MGHSEYLEKRLNLLCRTAIIFFVVVLVSSVTFFSLTDLRSTINIDRALVLLDKSRGMDERLMAEKTIIYQRALKLLKNATRLSPRQARGYFEYAEALTNAGDDFSTGALLDLNDLKDKPVFKQEDLFVLAKDNYAKAILNDPFNAVYHQRMGRIYDRLLDKESAEKEYNKAVALSPNSLSIRLYMAQYFLSKGREEDFLLHIRRAIELQKTVSGGVVGGEVAVFLNSINREDLVR